MTVTKCVLVYPHPPHRWSVGGRLIQCSGRSLDGERTTKNQVISRIRAKQAEIVPPYMFPETRDELCPGLRSTTVGEVIEDTWRCAFDAAIEAVAIYFEEQE